MKYKHNISRPDLVKSGLDPKLLPSEKLFRWLLRPRHPVLACHDDLANMFIEAMLTGEPVKFIYTAGSKPGAARNVKVSLVFRHEPEGRLYVSGCCPERSANRIFALDYIMVINGRK
jgi:hypothetical protein